jgi:hypothetical protein
MAADHSTQIYDSINGFDKQANHGAAEAMGGVDR